MIPGLRLHNWDPKHRPWVAEEASGVTYGPCGTWDCSSRGLAHASVRCTRASGCPHVVCHWKSRAHVRRPLPKVAEGGSAVLA